jgi:hypothetical protein
VFLLWSENVCRHKPVISRTGAESQFTGIFFFKASCFPLSSEGICQDGGGYAGSGGKGGSLKKKKSKIKAWVEALSVASHISHYSVFGLKRSPGT